MQVSCRLNVACELDGAAQLVSNCNLQFADLVYTSFDLFVMRVVKFLVHKFSSGFALYLRYKLSQQRHFDIPYMDNFDQVWCIGVKQLEAPVQINFARKSEPTSPVSSIAYGPSPPSLLWRFS